MCPPFFEVTLINSSRISCASCVNSAAVSDFTSAGPRIEAKIGREVGGTGSFIKVCCLPLAHALELLEGHAAILLLLEQLDLELGVLQPRLADFQELRAFLEL